MVCGLTVPESSRLGPQLQPRKSTRLISTGLGMTTRPQFGILGYHHPAFNWEGPGYSSSGRFLNS
ncbi:hypothetical protein BVC80_1199g18 [Macleaya cordata]|uniref:Uncharacterized protein n=1 Tax=Macleaya cordata TaxID=56857 RepID=A0A200RCG5_MACCD|nr:hypothetical protein BVC80_1199g18 [Macleaya cordata]